MEGYLSEVRIWAATFAPQNWAFCHGQLVSIAQNTALFSLLGTTYGGDGRTTFALPDLRSRVPIGAGHGNGLSDVRAGQAGGHEMQVLTHAQMPPHTHVAAAVVNASADAGTQACPTGKYLANTGATDKEYGDAKNTTMAADMVQVTVGVAGGGHPVDILPPYLGVNYIICVQGLFPSRA